MALSKAIVCFQKATPDSRVATSRIARFISKIIDAPIYATGKEIAPLAVDMLVLVNGTTTFCSFLPEVARAVANSRHIVYVQNDYLIPTPSKNSTGLTPYRAVWRERAKNGLPDMDILTTIKDNAWRTPHSAYVNWNQLTYAPLHLSTRTKREKSLLYYGSFREPRKEAFDRYFLNPTIPTTVASNARKFLEYGNIFSVPAIDESVFLDTLARYAMGLYIEDPRSHRQFHSPANRFYEMLSAGMALVFQEESVYNLREAGFDVSEWTAYPSELPRMVKYSRDIALTQRRLWGGIDYAGELRTRVKAQFKRLEKVYAC